MKFVLSILMIAMVTGCSDRVKEESERTIFDPTGGGELSDAGELPDPDPVRSLCSPGTSQCVGENSPVIERCTPDGEGYERDVCPPGEVCRNRRCESFACAPGTQLCVGNTQATCDATGQAVANAQPCPDSTVCQGGQCVDLCEEAAETGSYIGCEYVAARLPNYYFTSIPIEDGELPFPFGVVVANSHPFAVATIDVETARESEIALWPPTKLDIISGADVEIGSVILRRDGSREPITSAKGIEVPPGGAAVVLPGGVEFELLRVRSDQPVTAYQFNPYCCNSTFTNDASLLFPVNTWASRYRSIGYPSFRANVPYLAVYSEVAQEVTIRDIGAIRLASSDRLLNDGDSFRIAPRTIEYLEVWGSAGGYDLSGVEIEGTDPLAVFSGHPCTYVPNNLAACDHLEEQLPPADTLGREYLLTPIRKRGERSDEQGVYWRIAADEDATVTFDPPFVDLELLPLSNDETPECAALVEGNSLSLAEGAFCEFGTAKGVALTSSGAITAAGVFSGQQSTQLTRYGSRAGDPALFVLPPVAQFRDSYSFIAPPTYALNFVSIAAPAEAAVVLDGRNIEAEFRLQRQRVEINADAWELFTVPIEAGLHQMSSNRPFGIMVYAYDDYVSYAFVGGLDLLPKGAR